MSIICIQNRPDVFPIPYCHAFGRFYPDSVSKLRQPTEECVAYLNWHRRRTGCRIYARHLCILAKLIKSQECAELVELTMTIYAKKQEAQRTKKKLSSTDQAFLKEGEGLLFGELSVALGIPFDEVQAYIKNRLKSNKQNSF